MVPPNAGPLRSQPAFYRLCKGLRLRRKGTGFLVGARVSQGSREDK
jgi:hypothetical protein